MLLYAVLRKLILCKLITCEHRRRIVFGVIRTITLAGVFLHNFKNTFYIFRVATTTWIVGIGSTNQQGVIILLGKNSDIIIAVVLGLAFNQAKFCVAVS